MFLRFGVEWDGETNEFRREWSHFLDKVHGLDQRVELQNSDKESKPNAKSEDFGREKSGKNRTEEHHSFCNISQCNP